MVAMAQPWDYRCLRLYTGGRDPGKQMEALAFHFAEVGDEGWEAVLVLKQIQDEVYILLKRPRDASAEPPPRTAPVQATRSGVVW